MKAWTINITLSVSDNWVEDGFDAIERFNEIKSKIEDLLPYAHGHEMTIEVTGDEIIDKKLLLAIQLKKERELFESRDQSIEDHNTAIEWLEKGIVSPRGGDLLDAVMNDFDTIYHDYENY